MILYYCLNKEHKHKEGEYLIAQALIDYLQETDAHFSDKYSGMDIKNISILREPLGKPIFKDYNIQFSISHTANLWVCLMADHLVGVDVQQIRQINGNAVAKRFFTHNEQSYIQTYGEVGFFDIWCRKEAYVKYTGKGFAGQNFSTFSTINDQLKLTEMIQETEVNPLDFTSISDIDSQIRGAYCTQKKEELWIKRL